MATRILMYHSIGKHPKERGAELYCVSRENFKAQVELLAYKLGTTDHRPQTTDQSKKIIMTFDDGDETNYTEALPVLKKMGLKATFFVLVSKIGKSGYMTWDQVKELASAGMTIGSHCMTHAILNDLDSKGLDYEIRTSKQILKERLNIPIEYLSIPRGFYNKKVIEKAKETGYKAVFTSTPSDADDYRFGRIPVMAAWDITKFKRIIEKGYPLAEKTKAFIRDSSVKLLGPKGYNKLRDGILKKRT